MRWVRFSEYIRPICLRVPGLPITIERTIAGWGKIGNGLKDSDVLLTAVIYESPINNCKRLYESKNFKWNNENMLCAGAAEGQTGKLPDTCEGDSGGPLMARITGLPCSYVAVGVVSWGTRCGEGHPAVYTNTNSLLYLEWIANIVWPDIVQK